MVHPQDKTSNIVVARQLFFRIVAILTLSVVALLVLSSAPRTLVSAKLTPKSAVGAERRNARVSMSAGATAFLFAPVPFAPVTVDRTDDAPAASACTAAANDCSLRGAVTFANLNPGTTINLPAGTYNLTIAGGAVEGFAGNNLIGDVDITANNTSIIGAGSGTTTINQTQPNDRVIEVNPFLLANFTFSISGVTVSGGKETTAVGGGGLIAGSVNNTTFISNCVFSGNSASGAGTFGGGAVQVAGGSLTITGSTFSSNSSTGSGGGVAFSAGDPLNRRPSVGILTVSGSTFSGNTAASVGAGGGAADLFDYNGSVSSYSINSSSFSNNSAANGSGGAIIVESGVLTLTTSSFATNSANNRGGAIYSSGAVAATYSRFVGNSVPTAINGRTIFSVSPSAAAASAEDSWWGINTGPSANDIRNSTGSVLPLNFLKLRIGASPTEVCANQTSSITADIKERNVGAPLTVELTGLPAFPATFNNAVLGSVSPSSTSFVDGVATSTYTAGGTQGAGSVDATGDNQTVTANVNIVANATTDPADQSVCEGQTATFTTSTSGPGPVTYVWKKGATVLNNGDLGGRVSIVSGPSSSTLTITNAQPGDGDTYTVEATGTCGTNSQSANLSVAPNTTATDPVDQTVCQGVTANFSTTATGSNVHYAWTVDGSPFGGDTSSISVPTGSLSIGSHTVGLTVTGDCGSVTQSASLTVQANTTATDPADQTVCQGALAAFSTTAAGSNVHYAWTLDGSPFGGDTSSINVPTASLSIGSHTVGLTVTGDCGTVTQSANLTVQANTTASDPADQTVCQGALAAFATTATGSNLQYTWTLDGSPFGGNTSSISVPTGSLAIGSHTVGLTVTGDCGTVTQSANLTVQANTTASDPADVAVCQGALAGFATTATGTNLQYAWTVDGSAFGGNTPSINVPTGSLSVGTHTVGLTVTGSCGTVTQTATLAVNSGPTVTTHPQSQTVSSGNVTFTAAANGTPAPTVQWQVSTNGGATFSDIPGATSTTLTVVASPATNGNKYRAVFTNGCGTAITNAATLTTCSPPVITFNSLTIFLNNFTFAFTTNQVTVNGTTYPYNGSFSHGGYTISFNGTTVTITYNNQSTSYTFEGKNVILWLPLHQYQTVKVEDLIASATSDCDAGVNRSKVRITQVTSDEPENLSGGGDGNTLNDIVIAPDCKSVNLRAERNNSGNGRVYTITFQVRDSAGNITTATSKLKIRAGSLNVVDNGAQYTVNGSCPLP